MAGDLDKEDPSWEAAWDAEDPAAGAVPVAEPEQAASPEVLPEDQPEVQEPAEPSMADAIRQLTESQKNYAESVTQSVGGLAAELRQVNAEAAVAQQTPGGPSQEQIDEAKRDPASWAKLKEDWAEWASPIEELFDHRMKAAIAAAAKVDEGKFIEIARAEARREFEGLRAQERAEAQAQRELQEKFSTERTKVLKAIPTFDADRTSPEFKEWTAAQTPAIQALGSSMDAQDAITMMNLYAASRPVPKTAAAVQADRTQRLRQSAVPNRSFTPGPKQPIDTSRMTWEQQWEYDTQIKEAARQARPS